LVTALLRSLPKDLRRRLVPMPDTAAAVLAHISPADGSLLGALERGLRDATGVTVPRDAWRPGQLPDHLRMTFRVIDTEGEGEGERQRAGGRGSEGEGERQRAGGRGSEGRAIGEGPDLAALQRQFAPRLQAVLSEAAAIEREGLTAWTFGDELPRTFVQQRGGRTVEGFPALVDKGDSAALRVLGSVEDQQAAMWAGTRRLLLLNAGSPIAQVHRRLDNATKLALATNPHGSVTALLEDAAGCAVDELLIRHGGPVWHASAFADLLRTVRAEIVDTLTEILERAAPILVAAAGVEARLGEIDQPVLAPAVADMRTQLTGLVHAGFLMATGARRLDDVARYVQASQRRLDALQRDPARDRERMERVKDVQDAYVQLLRELRPTRRSDAAVREIGWMIEELRVGEFAQALGTAYRVSPQRVLRAIDDIAA
jgi:ATP-dependent helicase HrpA